jgi:hypothetical protein
MHARRKIASRPRGLIRLTLLGVDRERQSVKYAPKWWEEGSALRSRTSRCALEQPPMISGLQVFSIRFSGWGSKTTAQYWGIVFICENYIIQNAAGTQMG